MDNSLISVIIPIFNREKYIRKCIDSVIAQQNVNTEIILIDDGSQDNSGQICDEYAHRYSNIRVIHNSNHGVSHARNCGLDAANGDYIFFVDSDDSITSDALISLKNALMNNDADFCVGNVALYDQSGNLKSSVQIPDEYKNALLDPKTTTNSLLKADYPLLEVVFGKLYKKQIWDTLRFPVGKTSEDCYVLKDILSRSQHIFFLDKVIYKIVLTDNSITRAVSGSHMLCSTEANSVFIDYLVDLGAYELALIRFGEGTRKLVRCKRELKDPNSQAEANRIYKSYCAICKKFAPHVDAKNKIRFMMFRTNLTLYAFVRDFASRNHLT